MSENVAPEPDVRAIIQSIRNSIPSNNTQLCCLLKKPSKPPVAKKMIEEDIYEFYRQRLATMNEEDEHSEKRTCKCKRFDPYTTCVKEKKTIQEQKRHAVARENYLRTKWILEHPRHDYKPKEKKIKQVIDIKPYQSSGVAVTLKLASPTCSREIFFKPTRNLVGSLFS